MTHNVYISRRHKSIAPPLSVGATAGHHSEEELPIKVINRRKDALDLTFEVSFETLLQSEVMKQDNQRKPAKL